MNPQATNFVNITAYILIGIICLLPETIHASVLPDINNDSVVYVWDFSVNDPSIKEFGKMLTDDFETELINSGLYTVLERRRFNRLQSHVNLESRIANVQSLSTTSLDSLKAVQAGAVFFGEVYDDIQGGEVKISVTLQNLNGQNLRKGDIAIKRSRIDDPETRKSAMKSLMAVLHGKEAMAAKKEQYELISAVLKTYMIRVKDVQTRFEDSANFAFDDQRYGEELGTTIFAYNDIIDTLTANRAKYHLDFIRYWKEPRGQELESILSGILDNIHITYVLRLRQVRLDIAEYGKSTASKKEKKEMRKDILEKTEEITDDLERQINIMHGKINPFLSHLQVEISS